VLKRTKTGPSTDADVLEQLAEMGHELPRLILDYRELQKLRSTYVESLPLAVHAGTGRIHTSFNQTGAATGRLSSSDPNLQNIPVRSPRGEAIRRGFIPAEGCTLLVADYSQIELRLMAHLSGDPAFVAAFRQGGDIHRQTAALVFNVPLEAVTAEQRARAKTINFGIIYGQGPFALGKSPTSTARWRWRGSRGTSRRSWGGGATSPRCARRTSTCAATASATRRTRRCRARPPTSSSWR
jgi:DNA polymerase-1